MEDSRYLRIISRGQNLNRWSWFSRSIQNSEKMALEVVFDKRLTMLPDDNGRPLIFKAVSNHEHVAEIVLSYYPELAGIEHNGLTVTHEAVAHHMAIARRLLDQKSRLLKLKGRNGLSVEMFARISLGMH